MLDLLALATMKRRLIFSLRCTLAVVVSLSAVMTRANAADYSLCGGGFQIPPRPAVELMPEQPDVTHVEADDANLSETGISILSGNVQVVRNTMQLSAEEVHYSKTDESIEARGKLRLWDEGFFLRGSRGRMVSGEDTTVIDDASFQALEAHAHGSASQIVISGRDIIKGRDTTYSTCDMQDPDWMLRAERIRLDKGKDLGVARNVWVDFMDVPIFYSPYLSFPLSDARKSGFLVPSVGASGRGGVEATVPYYFNILPNMDATFAVRAMSERGVQLQGEYRYLFPFGSGEVGLEHLPSDQETNDARTGVSFQHRSTYNSAWTSEVDYNWVSDREYFEDLGTQLAVSSHSFLSQRADLLYNKNWLWARTRVQSYQTVDNTLPATSRPFKQLPQLLLITQLGERNRRLNFNALAEVVNFERRSSVDGVRWDFEPFVTFPYRTAAGYFTPRASIRYTGYALNGVGSDGKADPSRVLPRFSIDTGLFFDRRFTLNGRVFNQTLEPRLFYLAVPFDDQDDLPIFDTGEYSFNFAQLFRLDRFSGADRMGDAHQVTLALTSRILNPKDGREWLRASVGQIRYLRDRRVTLPNLPRQTRRGSDIVAELSANIAERWRASAGIQWNTADTQTEKHTFGVRYQPDARRVANLSYRFVRGAVEQTDFSFAWPFDRNWRGVGRWNYSLKGDRTLEVFAGLEYESCCWGLRTVFRRYLTDTRGDYNNAVFVQLQLKGLAGVGDAAEFLTKSIPGYRNEF